MILERNVNRRNRSYFGGLAGSAAACVTHPLDLVKVHLQTQQGAKIGMIQMGNNVVKTSGVLGLYNGISASIGRQMTYTITRFAVYEMLKQRTGKKDNELTFATKALFAGCSGFLGGVVGTPMDMMNVRMQNDMKLPAASRRNYKNAFEGLFRVARTEGVAVLFSGCTMASIRAVLMTIGQLSFYDQIKQTLLATGYFKDNSITHLTSSFSAGAIATVLTQPVDVMKTRLMSAPKGTYSSLGACAIDIAKNGLSGFYKGVVPSFIRLAPHTVLLFLFLEQLRLYAGYLPNDRKEIVAKKVAVN